MSGSPDRAVTTHLLDHNGPGRQSLAGPHVTFKK
jgi:hypothetical protein